MKQKLTELEGEDNSSIVVRYFNTPFQATDRKTRWGVGRVKKNIEDLNNSINHHDLLTIIRYGTQ